jgi:hypothetical protein
MTVAKIASLTTNNASGSTFTVPSGVTVGHLGILILGSANTGDQWTVTGWNSRVLNPTGVGNMSFQVFTRLGGLKAGDTFTVAYNTGNPATQVTVVWLDTQFRDIDIVGTPWTRNGTSLTTTTISGIATSFATDLILVAQERTTAANTTISSWSPSTPTQDAYFESNTTTFPSNNTDTSHYIGRVTQSAAGSTDYTVTYNGGSGNGVGVMFSLAGNAKAGTFADSFSSTTIDRSLWTPNTGAETITGNRLAVRAGGEGQGVVSFRNLDLTNSSICVEAVPAPGTTDPTDYTVVQIYPDGTGQSKYVQFGIAGNAGSPVMWIDSDTGNLANMPYDAVNHRWLRFRSGTGNTIYLETSFNGMDGSWVTRATLNATWTPNNIKLSLSATTGMNPGGMAYFDNINTPPAGYWATTLWSTWDGTKEIVFSGLVTLFNGSVETPENYFTRDNDPYSSRTSPLYCGPTVMAGPYMLPYPEYVPYPSTTVYPSEVNEYPSGLTYPQATNYPVSLYPSSEEYPGTYYPGGN